MIITVWMICFVRLIARLHYSFQSHVFHAVHLAGRYASQTHFIKNNTCHQRNTRRHLSCLSHYVTQLQQSKNEWYCTLPINPTWETMQNYPATSRQKLIMSSNTFAWKQPRHDQSCIFATSLAFGCCIVFAQTRDVIVEELLCGVRESRGHQLFPPCLNICIWHLDNLHAFYDVMPMRVR